MHTKCIIFKFVHNKVFNYNFLQFLDIFTFCNDLIILFKGENDICLNSHDEINMNLKPINGENN